MTLDEAVSYFFASAALLFVLGYIVGVKIRWAKGIVESV